MSKLEVRDLRQPDKSDSFPKRKVEVTHLDGRDVVRFVLEPGWKWSEHVGAATNTKLCPKEHIGYHLSGRLYVQTADGAESFIEAGQVAYIPAEHEAWVVGDEPVVVVDWTAWSVG
ncbi:MAG: cupin [Chloroflexi bacterium]|nr:cupin [Chloroflexota bacterium]